MRRKRVVFAVTCVATDGLAPLSFGAKMVDDDGGRFSKIW